MNGKLFAAGMLSIGLAGAGIAATLNTYKSQKKGFDRGYETAFHIYNAPRASALGGPEPTMENAIRMVFPNNSLARDYCTRRAREEGLL